MYTPSKLIEQWIEEDFPGFDLTSHVLGMKDYQASLTMTMRQSTVLCGTEEASAIFEQMGANVELCKPSGTAISEGETFMRVSGDAAQLHAGWRVALNLIEFASGIATRTNGLVTEARKHGRIQICGTRKAFSGGRRLSQKALISGGGIHHRMGLGESILIFPNHYNLMGFEQMLEKIILIKLEAPEKKIGLEVYTLKEATQAMDAGIDTLQLDKFTPDQVAEVVTKTKKLNPNVCIASAGGINQQNVTDYAATGVDILVTSWMYFGKPADISAVIEKV